MEGKTEASDGPEVQILALCPTRWVTLAELSTPLSMLPPQQHRVKTTSSQGCWVCVCVGG